MVKIGIWVSYNMNSKQFEKTSFGENLKLDVQNEITNFLAHLTTKVMTQLSKQSHATQIKADVLTIDFFNRIVLPTKRL